MVARHLLRQGWRVRALTRDTTKVAAKGLADDIGAFAALAFSNPQEWIGKALELAGDELTDQQAVETLTRIIGRPVQLTPSQGWGRYQTSGLAPDSQCGSEGVSA